MKLIVGSTHIISANITDVDNVKIELSRNNGADWETIAESVPIVHETIGEEEVYAPLSYPWIVTEPGASICLIRISGLGDDSDISQTTDPFGIIIISRSSFLYRRHRH